MRMFHRLWYGVGVLALLPLAAPAATTQSCIAGQPTAQSYTWNFHHEASTLLNNIRQDANKVADHADKLQMFALDPNLTWHAHAAQLSRIKSEVNDMGRKLCRLQEIRTAVLPWQRRAIKSTAPEVQLLADNATDAIHFLNTHRETLWMPTYRTYASNLYNQANRLSDSVHEFQQYAKANMQERSLSSELNTKSQS